ncbi:hypothetical protein L7F22_020752 [Adiantum nelumboides]|nr:hypothetical protein [Adiantum nelumboides]
MSAVLAKPQVKDFLKTLAKGKEKGQEQRKEHNVNAHAAAEEGEPSKKPWEEDIPELSSPSYSPPTSFSYSSDSSSSYNPRRRSISETMVLNLSTLVWSVTASVEGRTPIASEGLSVVSAMSNGEEVLVAFGGYNGRYSNELYIMKTNQKVKSQPKYLESPAAAAAASAVKAAYTSQAPSANGSNGFHLQDLMQENRVKEITVDIPKSKNMGYAYEEIREQLALASKASGDLEAVVSSLQAENARLKQELGMAQTSNAELSTELHSVRGQLDNEQSRCFRLEVDLAELRQKLHSMEALQRELELLRRQKAAADQVAASAVQKQSSGGVWGWLAGSPPNGKAVEA